MILCIVLLHAQSNNQLIKNNDIQENNESKNLGQDSTTKKTLIYLEHTDLISFDNDIMPDIQVLTGNVILRHDSVYLYCDSAYLNQKSNSFDAFGKIKIAQGDTINIFSNKLNYNGDYKIAKLFENVQMINKEVILYTDTLTYDRNINLAYYTCGGKIQDSINTLVSKHGYYNADTKIAEFKWEVIGTNETSNIKSDTLTYDTESNIVTILGPTVITHNDSTIVYSEKGWYDSNSDCSKLLKNSVIHHNNNNSLEGDTIYYDKKAGIGKAYNNVILTDSMNSIALHGNYGYYIEKDEIGLMTDSAMLTEFSQKDTIYVHSDTIYSYAINDSNKLVMAYHNVRLFQKEYQGVCDSLSFSTSDSILHLMQLPIVWTDNQQVTGDTIKVFPKDGAIDRIHIINNAIMVQEEDSIHYNQISGKDIIAYIKNENLDHVEVLGNSESIFYPTDQSEMIGMNKMESSYMTIYFEDGELERINIFPSPKATMFPMSQIKETMLYLNNFSWQTAARPKDKLDIFNKPHRATQADLNEQKEELKAKELEERKNKRNKKKENKVHNKEAK